MRGEGQGDIVGEDMLGDKGIEAFWNEEKCSD